MENRSNLKGLKPGLPDKEPGNTFPPLPISSQVTNTVVKEKHKKHWENTSIFIVTRPNRQEDACVFGYHCLAPFLRNHW